MKATIAIRTESNRSSGSAMLVALMLMAASTIGIAAWVSLVNARTIYSAATEDSMRRRVALENSRELAEEYLYRVGATHSSWDMNNPATDESSAATPYNPGGANDPNPAFDPSQPDIVERVQIDSWLEAPLQTNFADGRANRFSYSNGKSYSKTFRIKLGTGENLIERDFFLRSRSPILSGDLLTLNRPTITPGNFRFGGNILVNGRTVLWRPDMIGQTPSDQRFRTKAYAVMSSLYGTHSIEDTSNAVLRPSNFPFKPVSSGQNASSLGFDGRSSLVVNETNDVNSLHLRYPNNDVTANGRTAIDQLGVTGTGSGTLTIDLSNAYLKKVHIKNDTTKVRLIGQTTDADYLAAADLTALVIVLEQEAGSGDNLATVELYGSNNRRLVVGAKKEIASDQSTSRLRLNIRWMDSLPSTSWRLILLGENTELKLQHKVSGSQVTIYGGLMSDRGIWCHNNSDRRFLLEPEPDAKDLPNLVPRNVWLESYSYNP
ncbi:MAG: hypothetical protein ACI9MB_000687 [Verrucomicrobiales bacterium]|jgi:hypothetical protein